MKIQEFVDKIRELGLMYDVQLKDNYQAETEITVTRYGTWLFKVTYQNELVLVNPMFPQVKKGPEDKEARKLAEKLAHTPNDKKEIRYRLQNKAGQYLRGMSVETLMTGPFYRMSFDFDPYGMTFTPRQIKFPLQYVGLKIVEVK